MCFDVFPNFLEKTIAAKEMVARFPNAGNSFAQSHFALVTPLRFWRHLATSESLLEFLNGECHVSLSLHGYKRGQRDWCPHPVEKIKL